MLRAPTDRLRVIWTAMRGETVVLLTVLILCSLLLMGLGYLGKADCGGPPFDAAGRSAHWPVGKHELLMPCYSDLQFLWIGRDINNHVFPYIHGGIGPNGVLFGGAVEYPVLSGVLMYVGAIGAHTDTQFFEHSALLLLPFGLVITVLLGLLARRRALLWAATPPLILYAFHNWELPVVATAVAAVAVVVFGEVRSTRTERPRMPLRVSGLLAGVILALGFCLKLYPGLFVLPLAAYVLTRGRGRRRGGLDWLGAIGVVAAAAVTVVVVQLPFMVAGFAGWKASLTFQGRRRAEVDTNSIWYWGLRHLTGGLTDSYNSIVGVASPVLIVASFALAIWLGARVWRSGQAYPWVGVSAAMLAGFMLFHKVHSPQYTLWILPFFVLLRVRWPIVVLYLAADLALDLTIFRLFGIYTSGAPMKWWVMAGVNFGVWTHAVLLAILIFGFVRAQPRWESCPDHQRDVVAASRPTVPDRGGVGRDHPLPEDRLQPSASGAPSSTPPTGSS